jgi:hypothetical protein
MRLAVLAASSYAACQKLPEVEGATLNLDVLGQRLSEPDAGYTVHAFRAERGLAEALEQVLAEAPEPVEALLLYFSGYALVADERGPALLLDGERLATLSFKRLRRVLDERVRSAFLVLDTLSAFDSATPPDEAARLLSRALEPGSTPVHYLVAHRPEAAASERSPFASLLEMVLDWQSTRVEPLGADDLVRALRAEETLFSALPAVEYVPAEAAFAVLLGSRPASLLPEAVPALEPVPDPTRVSAEERSRALEASVNAELEGNLPLALEHARVAVRGDARDLGTLEWTLELLERSDKPDGVYQALAALALAGSASETQRALVTAHRPDGLLPARGVVAEADWLANLLCPECDLTTQELVRALGEGAVELGLETAQRKRRAIALHPTAEQDPEKSTTTLARTLVWSARVLGLPRPKLHILDAVPGELAIADTRDPTVLASKALGSGLSLPELAFRWARVLVYLRPELRLYAHFSGQGELEALGRAAAALVASTPPRLDGDAKLLLRGLRRHVRGPVLARLSEVIGGRSATELGARLRVGARTAELVAGRAGLLACGNLELAAQVSERAPLSGRSAAEQSADLVAYSLGDEYQALRTRLGVALTSLGNA